jgi:hypothetical protein
VHGVEDELVEGVPLQLPLFAGVDEDAVVSEHVLEVGGLERVEPAEPRQVVAEHGLEVTAVRVLDHPEELGALLEFLGAAPGLVEVFADDLVVVGVRQGGDGLALLLRGFLLRIAGHPDAGHGWDGLGHRWGSWVVVVRSTPQHTSDGHRGQPHGRFYATPA